MDLPAIPFLFKSEHLASSSSLFSSMASSHAGNSASSVKTLLRWLNLALITGSCAAIAIIILLRRSPTPWGWAFIAGSAVSILSGVTGLSSHINRPCFALHTFFLFLSVAGQGLGFLLLFSRIDQTERRLKPTTRNEADARILMKANAALLLVMFCVEMLVLVLACSLQCCAAERDYQGLDVEKRRGWGRKLAQVQEESLANATAMEEIHATKFNDKFKQKYGEGFDN